MSYLTIKYNVTCFLPSNGVYVSQLSWNSRTAFKTSFSVSNWDNTIYKILPHTHIHTLWPLLCIELAGSPLWLHSWCLVKHTSVRAAVKLCCSLQHSSGREGHQAGGLCDHLTHTPLSHSSFRSTPDCLVGTQCW